MTLNPARYLITGAAGWLLATAGLHWLPVPIYLDPHLTLRMAGLGAADIVLFAAIAFVAIRRLPAHQRLPACAAMVTPGVFGDALALAFVGDFFPGLNASGATLFAALLLLTYGVILATGLVAGSPR